MPIVSVGQPSGADAIVVSNHGGRRLDGAPASIDVLPGIVESVGDGREVWLDSGVRSDQDVFKALARGARGVLMGRAYVYGLGALGQRGVATALEVIRRELDLTMALCGTRSIAEIASWHWSTAAQRGWLPDHGRQERYIMSVARVVSGRERTSIGSTCAGVGWLTETGTPYPCNRRRDYG